MTLDYDILSKPRIGRDLFSRTLVAAHSPITPATAYASLVAQGVDPALGLAQWQHESRYGTLGAAVSHRNPGNLRTAPGVPTVGGFAQFPTWQAGVDAYARLLASTLYGRSRAYATARTMPYRYAPSADHNSPAAYGQFLVNRITQLTAQDIPPKPAPPPDPYGNPYPPGSIEYVTWMHDHGYVSQGGTWVKVTPPPPPPPPPALPPIPVVPMLVGANVAPLPTGAVPQQSTTLGGHPALIVGNGSPAFVLVHGGPGPASLADLPQRIATRGGRAYVIDYRSDTWQNAVADVTAAINEVAGSVVVVAHSFGGFPASIAVLDRGAGAAYAAVNAVSSLAGVSTVTGTGAPDPIALAANRPTVPIGMIVGRLAPTPPSDDKQGFVDAAHAAGHPGVYTSGPGDHTGTLYTTETLDALWQLAGMVR